MALSLSARAFLLPDPAKQDLARKCCEACCSLNVFDGGQGIEVPLRLSAACRLWPAEGYLKPSQRERDFACNRLPGRAPPDGVGFGIHAQGCEAQTAANMNELDRRRSCAYILPRALRDAAENSDDRFSWHGHSPAASLPHSLAPRVAPLARSPLAMQGFSKRHLVQRALWICEDRSISVETIPVQSMPARQQISAGSNRAVALWLSGSDGRGAEGYQAAWHPRIHQRMLSAILLEKEVSYKESPRRTFPDQESCSELTSP